MTKNFTIPLLIAAWWVMVIAAFSASFFWNANPECEGVTNYRVHRGAVSRRYDTNWNVGTATVSRIDEKLPAFYAVSAENDVAESGLSEEWFYVPSPSNARVRLRIMARSGIGAPWHEFTSIPLAGTNAAEFFRFTITP